MFSSEFSIENALLENRIRFLYEPRVAPGSLHLTGMHGVLCWNSGLHGWVDIERTANFSASQLARLWAWKLKQLESAFTVLDAHRRLSSTTPALPLSLSLFSLQLHSNEWVERMLESIDSTKLSASRIELELIDKSPVLNARLAESSFEILRRKGVGMVLNDFAMNPVSLDRLAHHAFSKVKLGKMGLPAMHESPATWSRKRDMLYGLIRTANALGADAVLDGIRTDTHMDSLRGLPVVEWRGPYWERLHSLRGIAYDRPLGHDANGAAFNDI
ncbi:MAG: diguanylate cyclase [Noviherbaspirillum sp.]|nr:diguanylate cyclase [Noviherbaspirillum sp.]